MGLFQAQDGFTHLLFANPRDSYILPGLVQLDLNGYLYYLLKKQGYRCVYFVSGLEEPFRLELYDEESREQYLRHGRKTGFWGKPEPDQTSDSRHYAICDDLPKRFVNLLKKSTDTAFVFRMDTFYEIFQSNRNLLKELVRTGQKFLEQNGNILLLQSPLTAKGSLEYLTDRKGIFADMDGVSLCPEVCLITGQDWNVKIYEQLQRELGARCTFFDRLTYELTQRIVRAAYIGEPDWAWTDEDVKDMAAFVYAWHTCARFRRQMGPMLSIDESRPVRTLFGELSDAGNRWKLRRAMQTLDTGDQKLRHYLREQYPPDEEGLRIVSDDKLAKKLRRIQIPQTLYGATPELGKVNLGKFEELVRAYQVPRSQPCNKALEDVLDEHLRVLEKAVEKGDTETFERAVKFLGYAVEREFCYDESQWQGWSIRTTILQLSAQLFELDELIRADTRQITAFEQKKKKLISEIEAEKAAVGGVVLGDTAQEHALSVKMHEAVNLERMIEKQIRARASKDNSRAEQITALYNLELTVGTLGLGMGQDVEQVLRDAMDLMEHDASHRQRSEKQLSEFDKSMDLVTKEMNSSFDVDLLEEYEKLIGSMEEEPLILLD